MGARPAAATARQEWADAAKGVCVALVVLGHVDFFHLLVQDWAGAAGAHRAWSMFGQLVRPLRMPLFFALAGFFAVRAVQRPWPVVLRPRVLTYGYLHVLWLGVWVLTALVAGAAAGTGLFGGGLGLIDPADPGGLLLIGALGGVGPWFLYALALYFVLGRLTARLPRALVVGTAAAVAVASFAGALPLYHGAADLQQNAVWYLAAVRYPEVLRSLVARARPSRVLLGGAVFVVVSLVRWRLDPGPVLTAVVEVPLRLLAVLTAVQVAVLVVRLLPRAASPWVRLGRRTLPVYVLHPPLLFLLHQPLGALEGQVLGALPPAAARAAALAVPLLVVALLVGLAVLLHSLALRAHLGWLFALPGTGRPRTVQLPPDPVPSPGAAAVPAVPASRRAGGSAAAAGGAGEPR